MNDLPNNVNRSAELNGFFFTNENDYEENEKIVINKIT